MIKWYTALVDSGFRFSEAVTIPTKMILYKHTDGHQAAILRGQVIIQHKDGRLCRQARTISDIPKLIK